MVVVVGANVVVVVVVEVGTTTCTVAEALSDTVPVIGGVTGIEMSNVGANVSLFSNTSAGSHSRCLAVRSRCWTGSARSTTSAPTVAAIVTVRLAPIGRSPRAQVTVFEAIGQGETPPPAIVAEVAVTPAAIGSVEHGVGQVDLTVVRHLQRS